MTSKDNIVNYIKLSPEIEAGIHEYSLDQMLKALAFMRSHPAIGTENVLAKRTALFALETWLYTKFGLPLCVADQMAGVVSELPMLTHSRIYNNNETIGFETDLTKIRFMAKYEILSDKYPSDETRFPIAYAKILN